MKTVIIILLCLGISLVLAKPTRVTSKIKERIIGGELAQLGDFPFIAAFYKTEVLGNIIFCVGALISDNCILTSAQCVDGGYNFDVLLGATNLDADDANSLRLNTKTYYITIGYNILTLENDIGIVMLRDQHVTFTAYIRPILLSGSFLSDYSGVVTAGWGQTSDDPTGLVNELRYVYLTAISNEDCQLLFQEGQIVDSMVCVSGNFDEGTCRGDLGNPLIQYIGNTSVAVQVGLSSFISSKGCQSTDPSGFTRIAPFVSWISAILAIE